MKPPMTFDFAIVGTLVEKDGKFLMVMESKAGREGLYNLPSGHVDDDETIAQAAVREVLEESGYEVELTGFLGFYQSIYPEKSLNVGGVIYLAKVVGGEAKPSKAHPDVAWFTHDELQTMAREGKIWTKYPPILIDDFARRGAYPLDAVSSERY